MSSRKSILCIDEFELGENILSIALCWTAIAMLGRLEDFPAFRTDIAHSRYIIHELVFLSEKKNDQAEKHALIVFGKGVFYLLDNTSNLGPSLVVIFASLSVDLDAVALSMRIIVSARYKRFGLHDNLAL